MSESASWTQRPPQLNVPAALDFQQFTSWLQNEVLLPAAAKNEDDSPSVVERVTRRIFEHFDKDGDGWLSIEEAAQLDSELLSKMRALNTALIVVDFQNDFITGSLSIKNGPAGQDPLEAIPPLNSLLELSTDFTSVVYTHDWHPENHVSFYEHCRDSDRKLSEEDAARCDLKPFDSVRFVQPAEFPQVLYPSHCVQNTWGAELESSLLRVEGAKHVMKGTEVFRDAYSGFVDNLGQVRSELEPLLRAERIDALFVAGLALDICVAATARDAAKLGFLTAVVMDASKGLSLEQIAATKKELCLRLNVAMLDSNEVRTFLHTRRVPWRWLCQLAGLTCEGETDDVGNGQALVAAEKMGVKT